MRNVLLAVSLLGLIGCEYYDLGDGRGRCREDGPAGCQSDWDCPPGQSCDPFGNFCVGPTGGSGGRAPAPPAQSHGGTSATGSTSGGSSGQGATGGQAAGTTGGGNGAGAGTSSGGAAGAGSTGGSSGGACVCPGRNLGQVPVGQACIADEQCGPNGICQPPLDLSQGASPTTWTAGYCTAVNCDSADPCPAGSECFFLPAGGTAELYSLCLADCGTAACRRAGYRCGAAAGTFYACLPDCSTDADCAPSLLCNGGACTPPCATAGDCGPGELCSAGRCQAGPPVSCASAAGCGAEQSCVGGLCLCPCQVDTDCPIGERCGSGGICG